MADLQRDEKRWVEAAALYSEYLGLRPADAAIWIQFGHTLKESGRLEEAEAAYRQSLTLRPNVVDAHVQLGHLLRTTGRLDDATAEYDRATELDQASVELKALANGGWLAADLAPVDEAEADEDRSCSISVMSLKSGPTLIFDVSDLISYFRGGRLPTGIQRVQMETITAFLSEPRDERGAIGICAFAERRDRWARIPADLFRKAYELSLSGGDTSEKIWMEVVDEITNIVRRSRPMIFARGAVLVNLGTSWLQNYLVNVRNAKERYGIRYIPFVHDLVPIVTPEHNVRELSEDFIAWLLGVLEFSDHFLVNSESTRADLLKAAGEVGHSLSTDEITVVPLNADFRKSDNSKSNLQRLRQWKLTASGYVLFVATIEPRKNHLGAFAAWLTLLRNHGAANTPKLVCVGKVGWLNAPILAKLNENETLRSHVVMMSKISDDDLSALYDHCLFTLYPSHYEGWGLPVTESLCHDKVPLIPAVSSLPEAGGEFAEYFEAGSEQAMVQGLERLIFDKQYRCTRERKIREEFRPRSWRDIGEQVERAAAQVRAMAQIRDHPVVTAQLGVFYSIRRNREVRIWPGMKTGELFRVGEGWWAPEEWGAWTRPGGAELVFRIVGPHERLRAYFDLRGLRTEATAWTIEFDPSLEVAPLTGTIPRRDKQWTICEIRESATDTIVRLLVRGQKCQYLARFPGSNEAKLTSIGFGGFYVCEARDIVARQSFSEAMSRGDLARFESGAKARDTVPVT